MNNISSKKMYFYISLSLVFAYFSFVLLAYNGGFLPELYSLKDVSLYYVFAYVLLAAVSYIIDIGSRKEPAFLTLFCLPTYSLIFLFGMMILIGIFWTSYILLFLIFAVIYALGYQCYIKWIERILIIKNGYDNILFGYVVIHIFIVLFVVFKMLNLL